MSKIKETEMGVKAEVNVRVDTVLVDTVLTDYARHIDGLERARVRVWAVSKTGRVFWWTQECVVKDGRIVEYVGTPTALELEHVIPQAGLVLDQSLPHRVVDSLKVEDLPVYETIARELERVKGDPATWQYLLAYNPMLG